MEIFGAAGNRTNTLAGQTDVIAGFVAASDLNAPLIVALSFGFRFVLNCVMTFLDTVGALGLIMPVTKFHPYLLLLWG
ncbi:MAG: hypothetical protein ACI901_000346 [Octadecabacter sp.]|jgi:hypothetical protein